MQEHTFRQYRTWLVWLDEQWSKPDRSDFYLMQIAAEVRKVLAKNRRKIKVEHFFLGKNFWATIFKKKQSADKKPETETVSPVRAAMSKAHWFSFLGLTKKPSGTLVSDKKPSTNNKTK